MKYTKLDGESHDLKMKHHIDGMHTTIQHLETCMNQVVDRTHEINEILGPNRQKITRCSMNYELLRKVRENG